MGGAYLRSLLRAGLAVSTARCEGRVRGRPLQRDPRASQRAVKVGHQIGVPLRSLLTRLDPCDVAQDRARLTYEVSEPMPRVLHIQRAAVDRALQTTCQELPARRRRDLGQEDVYVISSVATGSDRRRNGSGARGALPDCTRLARRTIPRAVHGSGRQPALARSVSIPWLSPRVVRRGGGLPRLA